MKSFMDTYASSEVSSSNRVLHTPSPFAREHLFYLQEAGTLKSLKSHCCRRENLDSFLILLVLSGRGTLTWQDEIFHLEPNHIAFIDCSQLYSHQSSADEPWELMWVHFNGRSAKGYFDCFLQKAESLVLCPPSANDFKQLISQIMAAQEQTDFTAELLTSKYLTDIMTLFFQFAERMHTPQETLKAQLNELREFLAAHFMEEIDVNNLAIKYHMPVNSLQKEFYKQFGISIDSYMLSRKLTHAKELLRFTTNSLSSIAESCGFGDEEEFVAVFKVNEGMGPVQYKMRW